MRQEQNRPDEQGQRELHRRRSRTYNLMVIGFWCFFLLFVICGVLLGVRLWQDWRDSQAYEDLYALVTEGVTAPTEEHTLPLGTDGEEATEPAQIPTEPSAPGILRKYLQVYEMNQDLFGWLCVDGTSFNYPVMFTPADEEYYLRRGFDKKYARSGVPFMDADCTTGCGNYLIYGHNMTNGTMFSMLMDYQREEFWKEHPVIHFDTMYEEGEYEVLGAFYSRVFYRYETGVFRFYEYSDLTDPEVFEEYVEKVRDRSLYDTGVEAKPGDQLITLITCSYGSKNERFVVVARKTT